MSSDLTSAPVFDPPAPVLEIARTLQSRGFEAWCVGGAIRDAWLGQRHLDWDLATSATPDVVRRLFRRTVPVGIEFGTVGVLDPAGRMHEVTTFRRDVRTDGRHAEVAFGASLDEDLARRDFTINAIAYDPVARTLRDPFDGRQDLARGIVRAVGEARARMAEDRLRALRAIRFAARFGFRIEPATWDAIVASAPHLGRLSPERVKQEIDKTLEQVDAPSRAFQQWRDAGAFAALVPALAEVGTTAMATIDCLPRPGLPGRPQRRLLRLAALFLDVPAAQVEPALRALRCSNQEVASVTALVRRWQGLEPAVRTAVLSAPPGRPVLRRWTAEVGRLQVASWSRLVAARWTAERRVASPQVPDAATARRLHRALLDVAFRDAIEVADLALDGDDLRRAGVRPGPLMGRALAALLDLVIEEPALNTVEALHARLPGLLANLADGRSAPVMPAGRTGAT